VGHVRGHIHTQVLKLKPGSLRSFTTILFLLYQNLLHATMRLQFFWKGRAFFENLPFARGNRYLLNIFIYIKFSQAKGRHLQSSNKFLAHVSSSLFI
jgi:hypothetical protein